MLARTNGADDAPFVVRPAREGNQEATMKKTLLGFAIALSMVAIGATSAKAQEVEGVTVTGSRIVKERVGRTPASVPINAISLAYKVSYSDLDLTSSAGKAALEKRVSDAALAACKEISRLHPEAKPDDAACAKAAVDEAMVKVREVIAAAAK
jgi:UrcA family protein